MGLDLTLGIFVLLGGIRGWFRGFLLQAVRLAALIGCVFLADPVRDLARPKVQPYLAGIQPHLLDRLLWWSAAVVSFVVVSGVGSILVKLTRRKPSYGEVEPNRTDQGAGFVLGAAKSAVMACFVLAAIAQYGPDYAPKVGDWAVQQSETSRALALSRQYQPADQIWKSRPVQQFVAHVRQRGLTPPAQGPAVAGPEAAEPEPEAVAPKAKGRSRAETASRPTPAAPKSLELPRPTPRSLDDEIEQIREELRRTEAQARAARNSR